MAAGGPVDPTMPLPDGERRGAPSPSEGEPTGSGSLPGAYDPTVAVPPVGPPDEPGDPYGPPPGDGDDGDDRKWLWAALAVLGVIILGVVIALLVTGGDDDGRTTASTSTSSSSSTSTSTSSSTSTSTSSTTPPTTQPGAPAIASFAATPSPFPCSSTSDSGQVTLKWSTTNATGVNVSIDGPGVYGSYGPNGQQQVPFASCSTAHTYTLTAKGQGNQQVQQTLTVQPQVTTTTTSTTTTTGP